MIHIHPNPIPVSQKNNHITLLYPYYTEAAKIKGSVVVLHGMAEHHERYRHFAGFLNAEGYDVYLYDHRGHGTDKQADELGYFASKDGDRLVIADAVRVLKYVRSKNRGNSLILFGHSMGSLIARNVLEHYDKVDCAVICGTAMPPVPVSLCGYLIASAICILKGPASRSPLMDRLLFSGREYKRLCTRSSMDWLSRDEAVVSEYNSDPFCGFLCTASFYRDLIRLSLTAGSRRLIAKVRKSLPIFLISGAGDPVGGCGRQVRALYHTFKRLGFTNVTLKLYPECRHELLNEQNRDDIMKDIASWLAHQPAAARHGSPLRAGS